MNMAIRLDLAMRDAGAERREGEKKRGRRGKKGRKNRMRERKRVSTAEIAEL